MKGEPIRRAAHILADRAGYQLPGERWEDLRRAMESVFKEAGSPERAIERGISALSTQPLDSPDLQSVLREVLIGETHLWRDEGQIRALSDRLRAALDAGTAPRVWCAGCSTGEEAYTVAIALREAGYAADDQLIVGTDLNVTSLRRAGGGIYGGWSFRGCPAELIDKHFDRLGDLKRVRRHIAILSRFEFGNLADFAARSVAAPPVAPFQFILCRNILMYFRTELARDVVRRFAETLAPGGTLLLGHAEHELGRGIPGLDLVDCGDCFVLERKGGAPRTLGRGPRLTRPPVPEPSRQRTADLTSLALAERLAQGAGYAEAIEVLDRALEDEPMNVPALLMRARARRELGELEAALADLDRCAYLDPLLVVAHIEALVTARALGNKQRAQRAARAIKHLLDRQSPAVAVPHGDGVTVADLRSWLAGMGV